MKMELDYNITFPSPQSKNILDDEEGVEGSAINDTEEPVVVLLGWAGCQDKHLAKYSSIYSRRCITIQYTCSTHDLFYGTKRLQKTAGKLLELLVELKLQNNPLLFHVFSNGGGMLYRFISELLHSDHKYDRMHICGCVFDSCPAEHKVTVAAKAYMATLNTNIIVKYMLALLVVLYLLLMELMYMIFKRSETGAITYCQALLEDPATCPQLFLYSMADEIVSYTFVEKHLARRKSRGIKVKSVCWEDSKHVQHLVKHRESYIQNCQDFLDFCLRQ